MSSSLWNSFAERKPGLPGKRDFSGIRLLSVDLNRLTVHSIPSLASGLAAQNVQPSTSLGLESTGCVFVY